VVFLVMEVADSLGIDVAEAFEKKLAKQAEKYPLSDFNPDKNHEEQIEAYRKIKAKTRTDYPFGEESEDE
jgi:DNA-directed RNA polymerase specialized sigma subunit